MPIDIPTADAADLITAGYKAVVAILRANAFFMAKVRRVNDWSDGKTQTALHAVRPADLVELSIVQGAFALFPMGSTSVISEVTQAYSLVAVTDTLQVKDVNRFKFGALAAFLHNDPEFITWGGNPFIRNYALTNGSDGTTGVILPGAEEGAARGISRLCSIVAVTLNMYLPREMLPA